MTSRSLDLTTVGHALNKLCDDFLGDCQWIGVSEPQREFLSWYLDHRDEISKLAGLEALASLDFAELNKFLEACGFSPMFEPFLGIGVASILDMLVEWAVEGYPTTINRESIIYPAFEIDPDGIDIYDVDGYMHPLVELHTKTRHGLWLMKSPEPVSGLQLALQAQQLLTKARMPSRRFLGVKVPMLEMDISPDLSWLVGMASEGSTRGDCAVGQAFQQFRLRANDKGARVKVATEMVFAVAACGPMPPPAYVFDEPFIGFFTQPEHESLASAAFWADTDVWRNPGGTIEEL